ncbi:MAG TPA: hypothetical protein VFK05_19055 [Polyangiaceae bacterium]|nr:hypothetical protein [Polyangiaceae bacterium]
MRDELLFAFLQPNQRHELTFETYARSRPYVSGGEFFIEGLWSWEIALLEHSRVPRCGRVLLGAAGGGRELRALLELGYEVFAFEPVAPLFESARTVAQGKRAVVVQADYDDLVARAKGKSGRLDGLGGHFDVCILGWASLSHLTEMGAAVDTLRALRALAPEASVIVSFVLRSTDRPAVKGGAGKLRNRLRRLLGGAGAHPVPSGLRFATHIGFYYEYSVTEFTELCAQTGYAVEHFCETPYPHALLLPIAGSG